MARGWAVGRMTWKGMLGFWPRERRKSREYCEVMLLRSSSLGDPKMSVILLIWCMKSLP
jgi:hypothetical protein